MPKVLLAVPGLSRDKIRFQPWKYAYDLAVELHRVGVQVTILTDSDTILPNTTHSLCVSENGLRKLRKESAQKILREKPDVIYFIGNSLSNIYVKLFWKFNIPIVLHLSSFPLHLRNLATLDVRELFESDFLIPSAIFNSTVMRFFFNSQVFWALTVPSVTVKKVLLNAHVKAEKIFVVPLYFDNKAATHLCHRTQVVRSDYKEFLVGYFGPPSTTRGTDTLIKAFSAFARYVNNARLVLFSRAYDSKDDEDIVKLLDLTKRLRISEKVTIIHRLLEWNKLMTGLRRTDVIVFPFKYTWAEPPISVLEALALGKPIITSSVGSLPEIIGNAGLTFPCGDWHSLSKRLLQVFEDDRLRVGLSVAARHYVERLPDRSVLGTWWSRTFSKATGRN